MIASDPVRSTLGPDPSSKDAIASHGQSEKLILLSAAGRCFLNELPTNCATDPKNQPSDITTLDPVDLLSAHGRFEHAQVLGKTVDYDPEIKTSRLALKLSEWDYEKAREAEKEDLKGWTKQKPGFESIVGRLIDAATPIWSGRYDYRKVLLDIREHLNLPGYPTESFAVIESQILEELLRRVLEKLPKMSPAERAAFEKSVEAQLNKEGKTLGGLSIEQLLLASGGASLVSVVGAEVASGIILAHLGFGHALLLALGLYSVPTVLIGGVIFGPIAAAFGLYHAGRHNYAKTIPFVATLAALRQQELVKGSNLEASQTGTTEAART